MGIHLREKKGKLYLDVYESGKRTWEKLDLTATKENRRLAQAILEGRQRELAAAREGLPSPLDKKSSLLGYCKTVAKTRPSSGVLHAIKKLEAYDPVIRLRAVNATWLEGFRSWLLEELAPSSAASYFQAIKGILRLAARDGTILRNPGDGIAAPKRDAPMRRPLTTTDLEALAAWPVPTEEGRLVARAFLVGCLTGLRVSDIRGLAWADIIRVPSPRIYMRTKKTKEPVDIPLSPSAWAMINDGQLHDASEQVFAGIPADCRPLFKRWKALAKLDKHLHWHISRYTFATSTLASGASIKTVQRLLAHKTPTMSLRYAQATEEGSQAAIASLPSITLKEGRK